MEIYNLKVKNLFLKDAVYKIICELKQLYAVKLVDVDFEKSIVRIILDELGCVNTCKNALKNMGYQVEEVKL